MSDKQTFEDLLSGDFNTLDELFKKLANDNEDQKTILTRTIFKDTTTEGYFNQWLVLDEIPKQNINYEFAEKVLVK